MPKSLRLTLPAQVREAGGTDLSAFIDMVLEGELIFEADGTRGEVIVDCANVKLHTPGCIVATAALARRWIAGGGRVLLLNQADKTGYAALDPRSQTGGPLFVAPPLFEFDWATGKLETIASALASACAPAGYEPCGPYPVVQYCCGELFSNCRQHARANAFAFADFDAERDLVRFAVADCGSGLKQSFVQNESPHVHPSVDDVDAVKIALKPGISSTTRARHPYSRSPNFGVGLSMVREFTLLAGGHFFIQSRRAWLYETAGRLPSQGNCQAGAGWPGTLVNAAMPRAGCGEYLEMLRSAHRALGLTDDTPENKLFT